MAALSLELGFKDARSTVDIDLTVQWVTATVGDHNQIMREMLQGAADMPLGDWFEFTVGPPSMDLTAAPYGGARYLVEARMNERTFARFHANAGVGDVVIPPPESVFAGKNEVQDDQVVPVEVDLFESLFTVGGQIDRVAVFPCPWASIWAAAGSSSTRRMRKPRFSWGKSQSDPGFSIPFPS